MSRPFASHSPSISPDSTSPTSTASSQQLSRRAQYQARSKQNSQRQSQRPLLTPHRRKVLTAGGAITLLAMAIVLPTQVSSEAIATSSCEQVIKSGAEISRGQISSLLTIPTHVTREAVRQVVAEPYCTLPTTISPKENTGISTDSHLKTDAAKTDAAKVDAAKVDAAKVDAAKVIEREAYPLAFDPEAWIVLNYSAGEYQGYDFVFKP